MITLYWVIYIDKNSNIIMRDQHTDREAAERAKVRKEREGHKGVRMEESTV